MSVYYLFLGIGYVAMVYTRLDHSAAGLPKRLRNVLGILHSSFSAAREGFLSLRTFLLRQYTIPVSWGWFCRM